MKCDLEEKNKLNKNLMVQLNQTKAAYKTKIKEQEHIVHHLKNEIERLKQKCGECLGKTMGLLTCITISFSFQQTVKLAIHS